CEARDAELGGGVDAGKSSAADSLPHRPQSPRSLARPIRLPRDVRDRAERRRNQAADLGRGACAGAALWAYRRKDAGQRGGGEFSGRGRGTGPDAGRADLDILRYDGAEMRLRFGASTLLFAAALNCALPLWAPWRCGLVLAEPTAPTSFALFRLDPLGIP